MKSEYVSSMSRWACKAPGSLGWSTGYGIAMGIARWRVGRCTVGETPKPGREDREVREDTRSETRERSFYKYSMTTLYIVHRGSGCRLDRPVACPQKPRFTYARAPHASSRWQHSFAPRPSEPCRRPWRGLRHVQRPPRWAPLCPPPCAAPHCQYEAAVRAVLSECSSGPPMGSWAPC